MTTTETIIRTTTNHDQDETKVKPSFAKRLCDSLERDSEMRAVSEDPENDYLGDMSHMLDMLDDECDAFIKRAIYFTLNLDSLDVICGTAVVALRESYLAGYRDWPKTDVAVAFAYAEVLTSGEIDKFIANDYLAYAPWCDIQDTLDAIAMLSVEANDAHERGNGPEHDRLTDEMVSHVRSILRDEHVAPIDEDAVRDMVSEYEHDHATLPESAQEVVRDYEFKRLPVDVWKDNETIDDTDEDYDELLKIGHLTVDDLLKGIPDGKGDKINIASALISGGLVCDPNGRVYLEAFKPTSATSNYPKHVADILVDNKMTILTNAFDIIDLAADHRTVQLSRDLYASILGFSEVPEEIWVPYVHDWEDDPTNERWARHERRWQAICGAYDEMYDQYNAGHPTFTDESDDEDETEVTSEHYLDEYLIATGGWLLVEDEVTEDRWYVNCLDVFGFDDARTVYDAGETWNKPFYSLRRHGMTAA